jgi:hypothetical protein
MGTAVGHRIGRHVHPDARPDLPPPPAAPTGIDYLTLVADQHRKELAVRINYTDLASTAPVNTNAVDPDTALEAELASFAALLKRSPADALPGQLDPTDLTNNQSDSEGQR